MATMSPWMKLKYILLISIGLLSLYAYLPFINGLGCDFKYEVKSGDRLYYSTCHMGWLKSVFKNLKSGQINVFSGVYGKRGDDIFFIALNKQVLEQGTSNSDISLHKHLINFQIFYTGKQFVSADKDIVMMNSPFYQIYPVKRVGSLGWWD